MKIAIIISVVFLITSCTVLPKEDVSNKIFIDAEKSKEFIKTYNNTSVDSANYYQTNFWNFFNKKFRGNSKKLKTKVTFDTKKKIILELIDGNQKTLAMKEIKGKIKNGCFYPRKKLRIYPFLPTIFDYNEEQSRICFSNDFLHLDYHYYGFAYAIIVVAGDNIKKSIKFKENKTSKTASLSNF